MRQGSGRWSGGAGRDRSGGPPRPLADNRSYGAVEEEVSCILEATATNAEEDARYGPDRRGEELSEGLARRT